MKHLLLILALTLPTAGAAKAPAATLPATHASKPACAAAWPCRCGCARQGGDTMKHTIRNAAIIILALLLAALLGLAVALILA